VTDKLPTSPTRSHIMSCIRSKETQPEIKLRKELWAMGLRGYRKYPDLPGKPDLLFPRKKIVIFVDGCFWHGCPTHYSEPKNNTEYWSDKRERNAQRDKAVDKELQSRGYTVLRFWEHDVVDNIPEVVEEVESHLLGKPALQR
jgi:DNA mismatch endonuclease (patch repair protein)